jgi:hypothetical protein
MCQPEGFHYFLNHIKQRLIIILDHNVRNGIDPCQADVALMRELYDLYDKGAVDTYTDSEVTVKVEQRNLFSS